MVENKNIKIFDNPDELDTLHLHIKAFSKGNKYAYMALMILALAISGIQYIVNYVIDGVKEIKKNIGL